MATSSKRLLAIGEFSAATQLSPKALRLYDEQRLLPPAHIDTSNGYRYYASEQVARGRIIRTLRDMGLTLAEIGIVVHAQGAGAEASLNDFAKAQDYRRAREKRAFQSALMMLRERNPSDSLEITERQRPALTVAVRSFTAPRDELIERFRAECHSLIGMLPQEGKIAEPYCALVDPLTDDAGRLDVVFPIEPSSIAPAGIEVRRLPAVRCGFLSSESQRAHAAELTGALDAMFDWFDRHGVHAIDVPLVSFTEGASGPRTEILWAFAKTTEE